MKVSGRLPWGRCLSSAYGYAFQTLMNHKENFSRVLGCAGRIFRAVATAEQGISLRSRMHWTYYMDAGSGSGFVENLMFWFPELRSIELLTQKAAACKLADARANYEAGLCNLATSCTCRYCDCPQAEQPRTGYCLVALVETILKAALILSNVTVDPNLYPTRLGFDRLYESHIDEKPHDKDTREEREKDLGPIVWVIEPGSEDPILHGIDHRMRLMMDGALGLSTFLREVNNSITGALASGGICAYWKVLGGLSIYDDHGFALGRIHIVPGRIESNGVAFDRVEDWYDNSSLEFSGELGQIFDLEMEFEDCALRMEQSFKTLRVGYHLKNSKKHSLYIPPVWLLNAAIGAHGWSRCQKRHSCSRAGRALGVPDARHRRMGAVLPVHHAGGHAAAAPDGLELAGEVAAHGRPVYLLLCIRALHRLPVVRPFLRRRGDAGRRGETAVHPGRLHRLRVVDPPGGDVDQCNDQAPGRQALAVAAPVDLCDRAAGDRALLVDERRQERLRAADPVRRDRGRLAGAEGVLALQAQAAGRARMN